MKVGSASIASGKVGGFLFRVERGGLIIVLRCWVVWWMYLKAGNRKRLRGCGCDVRWACRSGWIEVRRCEGTARITKSQGAGVGD